MPNSTLTEEQVRLAGATESEATPATPETEAAEANFLAEIEEQVVHELAHVTTTADNFIATVDLATPEGQAAQAEMEAVKIEASEAAASFWERLKKIFKDVNTALAEVKRTTREEELAIPDNPYVIKDLEKKSSSVHERFKKSEDKAHRRHDYKPHAPSPKDIAILKEIGGELRQATKENYRLWEGIRYDLREVLKSYIQHCNDVKKYDEALAMSPYLPDGDPDDYSSLSSIVQIISHKEFYDLHPELNRDSTEAREIFEKTQDKYMTERLAKFPDAAAVHKIRSFNPVSIVEGLTELSKLPERHGAMADANIEVLEKNNTPLPKAVAVALVRGLYRYNIRKFTRHTRYVQEGIRTLPMAERREMFELIAKERYRATQDISSALLEIMSYVPLEPEEREDIQGYVEKNAELKQLWSVDSSNLDETKKNKPLAFLTNPEILKVSPEEQTALLEQFQTDPDIHTDKKIEFFATLAAHPENYPLFTPGDIQSRSFEMVLTVIDRYSDSHYGDIASILRDCFKANLVPESKRDTLVAKIIEKTSFAPHILDIFCHTSEHLSENAKTQLLDHLISKSSPDILLYIISDRRSSLEAYGLTTFIVDNLIKKLGRYNYSESWRIFELYQTGHAPLTTEQLKTVVGLAVYQYSPQIITYLTEPKPGIEKDFSTVLDGFIASTDGRQDRQNLLLTALRQKQTGTLNESTYHHIADAIISATSTVTFLDWLQDSNDKEIQGFLDEDGNRDKFLTKVIEEGKPKEVWAALNSADIVYEGDALGAFARIIASEDLEYSNLDQLSSFGEKNGLDLISVINTAMEHGSERIRMHTVDLIISKRWPLSDVEEESAIETLLAHGGDSTLDYAGHAVQYSPTSAFSSPHVRELLIANILARGTKSLKIILNLYEKKIVTFDDAGERKFFQSVIERGEAKELLELLTKKDGSFSTPTPEEKNQMTQALIDRAMGYTAPAIFRSIINSEIIVTEEQRRKFMSDFIKKADNHDLAVIIYQAKNQTMPDKITPDDGATAWTQFIERGWHESLAAMYQSSYQKRILLSPDEQEILLKKVVGSGDASSIKTVIESDSSAFEARIQKMITTQLGNPEQLLYLLTNVAKTELFPPELISTVHKLYDDLSRLPDTPPETLAAAHALLIDTMLQYDPTVKRTFQDPRRLGKLKDTVEKNLVKFITTLDKNAHTTEEIGKIIRQKLQHIKKIFESSDSAESDRRSIFLDDFHLSTCTDPSIPAESIGQDSAMREITKNDLQKILILSGSTRELRVLKNKPETINPETLELLAKSLEQKQMTDSRNRALYEQAKATGQAELFLPENALTHGTREEYLRLILEDGNLSGELLGASSRSDASGALGVDVSKVMKGNDGSFSDRYKKLGNGNYGNVLLIYGDYADSERPAYFAGTIGEDHHLVRTGFATTEITAMVARSTDENLVNETKKDIATKGIYIPLLDTEGNVIFTPEDFDEMKVIYHRLADQGYPQSAIDSVYDFYKNPTGSEKHKIVIEKAYATLHKQEMSADFDLAILVDFLKTNDLNTRDIDWYKTASFTDILSMVTKSVGVKNRARARELLWGDTAERPRGTIAESIDQIKKRKQQPHVLLDAFFKKQLPFIASGDSKETPVARQDYERGMTDLLFTKTESNRVLEVARLLTEEKKQVMRRLWDTVWTNIRDNPPDDLDHDEIEAYHARIIPAVTGSVGRGEVVLGSDLDYLLYVDDTAATLSEEEQRKLSAFVNKILAERMNDVLHKNGIVADAGLAKQDAQPFTLISTMKTFAIELNKNRQVEEPTTTIDSEALFPEHNPAISHAKEALLIENPTASLLDSYILKDLEIGSNKRASYTENFEKMYASVAAGNMLEKVKESLQRVIVFKLYHLMFSAFNDGRIPKTEAGVIPASTVGKIEMLVKHHIITSHEAAICTDLMAISYKLRFLGELYSDEARQMPSEPGAEPKKIKSVNFRLDDFSYEERTRLVHLLKDFKTEVLYK